MLSVLSKTFLKIILNFCDSFSFDKYCPFEHFFKGPIRPRFLYKNAVLYSSQQHKFVLEVGYILQWRLSQNFRSSIQKSFFVEKYRMIQIIKHILTSFDYKK